MKFKYEITRVGGTPTWNNELAIEFTVPVSAGDKIRMAGNAGSDLKKVVAVEHYPDVSVLYVE